MSNDDKKEESPIDKMFRLLAENDVKMVWGIQPRQMERIEAERKYINELSITGEPNEADAIYSSYFWKDMAKEFAWEPLTLALFYFEKNLKTTTK